MSTRQVMPSFLRDWGFGLILPLLVLLSAPAQPATAQDKPVHILPLGDSITQGGRRGRPEYTYRLPLFRMLTEAGVRFDFIGSTEKGLHEDATWPDPDDNTFDPDHEGHYGWTTGRVRDSLATWVDQWSAPPDIALIHLGTNDQDADDHAEAVAKPLGEIIEVLRHENPNVIVLLGHLNFHEGAALSIRPLVDSVAHAKNTERSPVETVPHYKNWTADPDAEDTDTFDWAHPNPQGQRKMAWKWFKAMRPYLVERFGASISPVPSLESPDEEKNDHR